MSSLLNQDHNLHFDHYFDHLHGKLKVLGKVPTPMIGGVPKLVQVVIVKVGVKTSLASLPPLSCVPSFSMKRCVLVWEKAVLLSCRALVWKEERPLQRRAAYSRGQSGACQRNHPRVTHDLPFLSHWTLAVSTPFQRYFPVDSTVRYSAPQYDVC